MDNGLEKLNIQWYPGHMTKAGRMISANVANVDAVCEILDARIPTASRNPDIDSLAAGKPRLVLLNRSDLADPSASAQWKAHFKVQGLAVLETAGKSGKGSCNDHADYDIAVHLDTGIFCAELVRTDRFQAETECCLLKNEPDDKTHDDSKKYSIVD